MQIFLNESNNLCNLLVGSVTPFAVAKRIPAWVKVMLVGGQTAQFLRQNLFQAFNI